MKKRTIRTVALLTVLGMTAVSCQKEPVVEPQGTVAEIGTVYTVRYAVDGVTHSTTLYGETAWQEFLDRIFALAEQGHRVSFVNEETTSSINPAKETDMLVNCQYNGFRNSEIYHIDTNIVTAKDLYEVQDIQSLDFLKDDCVNFIGSGYGSRGELWFYKYSPYVLKRCAENQSKTYNPVNWDQKLVQKKLSFIKLEPFLSLTIQNSGEKIISLICGSEKDE